MRTTNTNRIASRILELYQPELRKPRLKAIKDNEPQVTALVKNFIVKLIDSKLTADIFTDEFGQAFIPRSGRATSHLKSLGDFKSIQLLDRKDGGHQSRIYHYRLLFNKEAEELLITITKDNKIAAIEGRE